MQGDQINYDGDPLEDFGIGNFLDRISFKNPKTKEKLKQGGKKGKMSNYEAAINTIDVSVILTLVD
jgi:hypothetical protein